MEASDEPVALGAVLVLAGCQPLLDEMPEMQRKGRSLGIAGGADASEKGLGIPVYPQQTNRSNSL